MSYHFTYTRLFLKTNKQKKNKCWPGYGEFGNLPIAIGNIKWGQQL